MSDDPHRFEQYVKELFEERFGIELSKIKKPKGKGKSPYPDFEFVVENRREFVCEVKGFISEVFSEERGWKLTPGGKVWESEREDNAPSRVAKKIEKGVDQLRSYAPSEPKVLIFVTDNSFLDEMDLFEAFHGFLCYGDEHGLFYKNVASQGIANGRLKPKKREIDLYIWLNRFDSDAISLKAVTKTGKTLAERFFKNTPCSEWIK